jgi:hypothetical protein
MFYNFNENKITNFKLHNGAYYYKAFTKFVNKTLQETTFNKDNEINILIPKFFVNKTLSSCCKLFLDITLIPYTNKVSSSKLVQEIKKQVKNIPSLNNASFSQWITNFNSNSSYGKGLLIKTNYIKKEIKRLYSTIANSSDVNNKNDNKAGNPNK